MKNIYLLVLLLWGNLVLANSKTTKLEYNVSPLVFENKAMLEVKFTFEPNKGGITKLAFKNEHWGEENLFECLKSIKILDRRGGIDLDKDNNEIIINHEKGLKELQLTYVIQQDNGDEVLIGAELRPTINRKYFEVFGQHLFIWPQKFRKKEQKIDVIIKWLNFPDTYVIHNSFGSNEREQYIQNISQDAFSNSVFVGGDYSIKQVYTGDKSVYMARRGTWDNFSFEEYAKVGLEVFATLNSFWKNTKPEYYTIILSEVYISEEDKKNVSMALGTGLTNSFNAVATPNIQLPANLFCHEYNHNWIGLKIKNTNEEAQYWFSEGFTEYYTIKLMSKHAIHETKKEAYINNINKVIEEHWQSKVRNASNSEITTENFWNSTDYEKLPYNRGLLFAFYLDQKIIKESKGEFSLDDVMRLFLKNANEKNKRIKGKYFIKIVNKFLESNINKEYEKYIENGELISFNAFFEENDVAFEPKIIKLKKLGLTFKNGLEIAAVEENSTAKKMGIQVGDILKEYDKAPEVGKKSNYVFLRNGVSIALSVVRESVELDIPQISISQENLKKLHMD